MTGNILHQWDYSREEYNKRFASKGKAGLIFIGSMLLISFTSALRLGWPGVLLFLVVALMMVFFLVRKFKFDLPTRRYTITDQGVEGYTGLFSQRQLFLTWDQLKYFSIVGGELAYKNLSSGIGMNIGFCVKGKLLGGIFAVFAKPEIANEVVSTIQKFLPYKKKV